MFSQFVFSHLCFVYGRPSNLNVPTYGENQISQWLRKMNRIGLAIILPELGVFTAFDQLTKAWALTADLHQLKREHELQCQEPRSSFEVYTSGCHCIQSSGADGFVEYLADRSGE